MSYKNIIVISGPTATGKTHLSIRVSELLGGAPIINFDSLLFYRELNIGTAKPNAEERKRAPHYLIDVTSINAPMNAADYTKLARPLMDQLSQSYPVLLLVGGSGFYLRALLHGMYDSVDPPDEILNRSQELYVAQGISPFMEILSKCDPETMGKLHPNDHYRIRRAVEHFWAHGTKFSEAKKGLEKKNPSELPLSNWRVLHCYLDLPKDIHLEVIRKRTQQMFASGLVQEVRSLLTQGFSGLERPLRAIGYKEVIDYLHQEIPTEMACQERIMISTRQLAKAQRTWFKGVKDKVTYNSQQDQDQLFQDVQEFMKGVKGPNSFSKT